MSQILDNIPALLRSRRTAPAPSYSRSAPILSCIYPNRTLYNVETPDCTFRRFTPDGKYLIAFKRNLNGIQVFRVITPTVSSQQLQDADGNVKSEFYHFFQLSWTGMFTTVGQSLHRDLCLVTANMRHMVVARISRTDFSSTSVYSRQPPQQHPNMLTCIRAMDDISILVIDIKTGRLVDSRRYPNDIICLSGHSGVSLYGDRLCILSLKHQCLRILRIERDGHLVDLQEIGWYAHQDDSVCEDALQIREEQHLEEAISRRPYQLHRGTKRRFKDDGDSNEDDDGYNDTTDSQFVTRLREQLRRRRIYPLLDDIFDNSSATPDGVLSAQSLDPGLPDLFAPYQQRARQRSPSPTLSDSDFHCPDTNVPVAAATSSSVAPPSAMDVEAITSDTRRTRTLAFPGIHDDADMLSSIIETTTNSTIRNQRDTLPNAYPTVGTLVGSVNPAMSIATVSERTPIMPFHRLQRLPPQYRLMLTRAMQHYPTSVFGRLELLADSDISLIEPSLTSSQHGGLRQKLLATLFMRARAQNDNGLSIQCYFRSYRQYEGLVLWRAQFLTPSTMLLRFSPLQVATSRSNLQRSVIIGGSASSSSSSAAANSSALLAEYDIVNVRFGRIWETSDDSMFTTERVEQLVDTYRAPMSSSHGLTGHRGTLTPSLSNDVYLREFFESNQTAIRTAKTGGPTQAARKALSVLPCAPQCTQESPLLDPSLFKCNLKTRQMIERYKQATITTPIRFYDRLTGAVKFMLSPTPYTPMVSFAENGQSTLWDGDDNNNNSLGLALRSGAVLLSSAPLEDAELDISAATGGQQQAQQGILGNGNSSSSSQKTSVSYLFHPTLPLVLSTKSESSGMPAMPMSNIHFWHGT